jgi:SAM-dependent methyltransferase
MTEPENSMNRAALWGDYVGWDARKAGENGFLIHHLTEMSAERVLDVALGDGVDTVALIEAGLEVDCNEADPHFRARAIAKAAERGITLEPTGYLWPDLAQGYDTDSYDAIVCLGHSIGCVLGSNDRIASLGSFHQLLRPGGSLIVDERNFRKIEDGIVVGKPFRPSGKYVYTGSGKIELTFIGHDTDTRTLGIEYRHTETGTKAYYQVHSFGQDELPHEMQAAGFSEGAIATYSDYQPAIPPNPQADYYQYIATK